MSARQLGETALKEDRMLSFMYYYFSGSIQRFTLSSWPLPQKDVLKPLKSLLGLQNAASEIVFRLESKAPQLTDLFCLQGMKRPELRDELYMQLIKQSRGNVTASAYRVWELFLLVASTMPPSKEFVGLVSEYVHTISHTEQDLEVRVKHLALRTWHALKRSTKAGSRRTVSLFS